MDIKLTFQLSIFVKLRVREREERLGLVIKMSFIVYLLSIIDNKPFHTTAITTIVLLIILGVTIGQRRIGKV